MTDIPPQRKIIQLEETRPQSAITESVQTRIGAATNFINTRHYYVKEFCVNGAYSYINPNLNVDGGFTYPWAFEIVEIVVKLGDVVGTGGLTELDLKWRPENTGAFASIFTTTPKWDQNASAGDQSRLGNAPTGFTQHVLSKTTFAAYDQIRLDQLQAITTNGYTYSVTIYTRPI